MYNFSFVVFFFFFSDTVTVQFVAVQYWFGDFVGSKVSNGNIAGQVTFIHTVRILCKCETITRFAIQADDHLINRYCYVRVALAERN